jgi:hypothetical protein
MTEPLWHKARAIFNRRIEKMTEFDINPKYLEMWLHQNRAEYTGDCVEGVLLDNFVLATKRGFAAVYEKYCNEWTSCYHVVFEPGTAQNMFRQWYKFEKEAQNEQSHIYRRRPHVYQGEQGNREKSFC